MNSKLSSKIKLAKATYLKNLDDLSLSNQGHFLQRLYQVSGNIYNKSHIINNYKKYWYDKFFKFLSSYKTNNYIEYKRPNLRNYQKNDTDQKFRFDKRYEYFNNNSKSYNIYLIIWSFYKYYFLTNDQEFFKKYNSKVLEISQEDYFIEDLFINDPVKYINTSFALRNLNLIDNTESIFTLLKKNKHNKYFNIIDFYYSLTHILIGYSNFYDNFIENNIDKTKWILKDYEKNIDVILKNTNIDIIAEVYLCFLLMKKRNEVVFEKIETVLETKFDKSLKIFTEGSSSSLSDMEHANILIIMNNELKNKLFKITNL